MAAKAQSPPAMYIDKNTCPGEDCAYGKWQAEKSVPLFISKSAKSRIIKTIKAKEIVKAISGDVYTTAGIFILEKSFEHTEPVPHIHPIGERIHAYTYLGEGFYSFWCEGKVVNGFFQPDASDKSYRNGHWVKEPDSVWWAKLKTKNGITGWTNEPNAFIGSYRPDQDLIQ